MDLPTRNMEWLKELVVNRRAKAVLVGVLALIVVVVLQVGNLQKNKPMCELLADCELRSIDLHRIQIALSKSGLSDFDFKDNCLMVPKTQHAEYLQAVSDQNAIPAELQSKEESSAISNPFLSRSQQMSIERAAKKRQIQQMVVRLPFVDQAWFEMDTSESRATFRASKKSAVIEIQPFNDEPLYDQNIDTVRQMISGAISGIDPGQVVVIDLSTGVAHGDTSSVAKSDDPMVAQRVAFARQQQLESRIRNALRNYPGVRVSVMVENLVVDRVADNPSNLAEAIELVNARSGQFEPASTAQSIPATMTAGANGQASIYDQAESIPKPHETMLDPEVQLASNTTTYLVPEAKEKVSVFIDVPCELLAEAYGVTNPSSTASLSKVYQDVQFKNDTERYFARLKGEMTRVIQSMTVGQSQPSINFNLIRPPVAANQPAVWTQSVGNFVSNNWPSLAVLLIGLVLITLITQPEHRVEPEETSETNSDADIVSINSRPASTTKKTQKNAEVRLSNLIEKDPDAAAKVIESWIRDAA